MERGDTGGLATGTLPGYLFRAPIASFVAGPYALCSLQNVSGIRIQYPVSMVEEFQFKAVRFGDKD